MFLFKFSRSNAYPFLFFAFFFLFLSQRSFALDYYWGTTPVGYDNFPSALSACVALSNLNLGGNIRHGSASISKITDSRYQCKFLKEDGTAWISSTQYYAVRQGTGCDLPKVYNPETTACEVPLDQCSDKAGQSSPFSKTGPRGDGYYSTVKTSSGNYGVTPNEACLQGCAANLNQACVYTISADKYVCTGIAYFTGASCQSGTPAVESDNTQRDMEPEVTNKEEPCVYVTDAEGRSHCVSSASVEQAGQNCGTAGPAGSEQVKCFPKVATKNETKTETTVEEKPTPDGGKTTTKTDTHTETRCQGDKTNCTTTVTKTTTTTKKDGTGSTTSVDVVCTGPKCGTDGKGGGGGGGSSGGSEEGDGEGGELPGNDDVPGFGDSLESFTAKIQGSPIVSAVSNISFPSGGSCYMPSANVAMLGTISFDSFCQYSGALDALYFLMLGVWAIGSVRLFLEA